MIVLTKTKNDRKKTVKLLSNSLTVDIPGALDLVGGGGSGPDEVFWKRSVVERLSVVRADAPLNTHTHAQNDEKTTHCLSSSSSRFIQQISKPLRSNWNMRKLYTVRNVCFRMCQKNVTCDIPATKVFVNGSNYCFIFWHALYTLGPRSRILFDD